MLTTSYWQDPARLLRAALCLVVAGAGWVLLVRIAPIPAFVSYVAFSCVLAVAPALVLLAGFEAWAAPSARAFAVCGAACMLELPLAGFYARADLPAVAAGVVTVVVFSTTVLALWTIGMTTISGLGRLALLGVDLGLARHGKPSAADLVAAWWERADALSRVSCSVLVIAAIWLTTTRVLRALPVEDSGFSHLANGAILDVMSTGEELLVGLAGAALFALAVAWAQRDESIGPREIQPKGRKRSRQRNVNRRKGQVQ